MNFFLFSCQNANSNDDDEQRNSNNESKQQVCSRRMSDMLISVCVIVASLFEQFISVKMAVAHQVAMRDME